MHIQAKQGQENLPPEDGGMYDMTVEEREKKERKASWNSKVQSRKCRKWSQMVAGHRKRSQTVASDRK